jgi:hypothetical protein
VVLAANVPCSVPTETVVPDAIVKPAGNCCCDPVGLLDSTSVPAPVLSVVIVPTDVPPMVTGSVLLAVAPVTEMVNRFTVTPNSVPV